MKRFKTRQRQKNAGETRRKTDDNACANGGSRYNLSKAEREKSIKAGMTRKRAHYFAGGGVPKRRSKKKIVATWGVQQGKKRNRKSALVIVRGIGSRLPSEASKSVAAKCPRDPRTGKRRREQRGPTLRPLGKSQQPERKKSPSGIIRDWENAREGREGQTGYSCGQAATVVGTDAEKKQGGHAMGPGRMTGQNGQRYGINRLRPLQPPKRKGCSTDWRQSKGCEKRKAQERRALER